MASSQKRRPHAHGRRTAPRAPPGGREGTLPASEAQEILDAAHLLEDSGLIDAYFAGGMTVGARMTGYGRMQVEAWLSQPDEAKEGSQFVRIEGSNNQVVIGAGGDVVQQAAIGRDGIARALELLGEALGVLGADGTLDAEERSSAIDDFEAARVQLRREKPNLAAARALVEPAVKLAPVGSLMVEIIQAVHG